MNFKVVMLFLGATQAIRVSNLDSPVVANAEAPVSNSANEGITDARNIQYESDVPNQRNFGQRSAMELAMGTKTAADPINPEFMRDWVSKA